MGEKCVGEEYQVEKSGREYHGLGKYKMWKRGKGKQLHLPYNIKAVVKIIKWERGRGKEILQKKIENQILVKKGHQH